ncbi:ABC transporter permease subunit [Mycoplasmopsis gallinarum]|uniref:ABC transporter permease subunit n=1 Tax=Mycoplasmopsis gallinarum TaxID=29557 RepID=UPI0004874C9A|nr:ABC transporter permease subunit [Mycoplasmopsis gallinarum]
MNKFKFVQKNVIKHSPVPKNNTKIKNFFKSKINLFLLFLISICLLAGIITLFLNNAPLKKVANLNLDKNMPPYWNWNFEYSTKYNAENNISQAIQKFLEDNNLPYFIGKKNGALETKIYFNLNDFFQAQKIQIKPFLGTDSQGKDVFIYSGQLFTKSIAIAATIFAFELFFGLFIGVYLASKKQISLQIIKTINVFISIPDIVTILLVILFTSNWYIIYFVIFLTGTFRMIYWAYQYGVYEFNQAYIDALISNNVSLIRIIWLHIIPKIIGKILIIFIRRISYIIFLIATLEFIGANTQNNIGSLFKDNWNKRDENLWQIWYPTFYLLIFFVSLQLIAINLAKTLDQRR